jgi:hypothetical protein
MRCRCQHRANNIINAVIQYSYGVGEIQENGDPSEKWKIALYLVRSSTQLVVSTSIPIVNVEEHSPPIIQTSS